MTPGLRPRLWRSSLTAEDFELVSADEAEAILADRYCHLVAAGYPPTSALVTASHVEIDVDLAAQLVCEHAPGPAVSLCLVF